MNFLADKIDLSTISNEEITAQNFIKSGEIDQAIVIYQQIEPKSARIFGMIGMLYADRKGDYELAIIYYEQALHIQEKNNDDIRNILTRLGYTYQSLHQFDLALAHHLRAINFEQSESLIDQRLLAANLIGMANAYWGQKNLSDALVCAQQALVINESVLSEKSNSNIASNLAILANIYHDSGDDIHALELAKRALNLFEHCTSTRSIELASILNNIGAIQVSAGLFNDALVTFVHLLNIYETIVPENHPKRIVIDNNIRQIMAMQQQKQNPLNLFSHLQELFTKFLLF